MSQPKQPKPNQDPNTDPYLWLEEVLGDEALAWVRKRNEATLERYASGPGYRTLEGDLLKILDSDAKIPFVNKHGAHYYNFWRDAEHPRGLWRRTTLAEYRKPSPRWQVILDIDALGQAEGENWVFSGVEFLRPGHRRCLVSLSRGGADATVTREFDLATLAFVADGFELPEAKGGATWIDFDRVFVATDFGPGSMTSSGYPRIAKVWRRGTPLAEAQTIFEGQDTDIAVSASHDPTGGFRRSFLLRAPTFYSNELFLLDDDFTPRKLDKPDDANASVHRDWLLLELRSPWETGGRSYPQGALLGIRLGSFLAGARDFTVLFAPSERTSLAGHGWTRHHLILNVLDDVKNRLTVCTPPRGRGAWQQQPLAGAPAFGTVSASAVDELHSDAFFMTVTDFLTPTGLYLGRIGQAPEKLKETPAYFDAAGLEINQHFATSEDGTRIPYFQVSAKGLALNGDRPTLLSGYGGFEVSNVPYYSGMVGRAWLSQGGVYALANIRGGGEYGPRWHQAALKQNRPRAFEDFAAVARDLAARKVTCPRRLGILGGSNGGLLMGNMLTRYPELFGAIVCQVPLLDMKRYSHLLAGASWMAEYGDPDLPEEWAFIREFSPYHNVRSGVRYPPVLFMTSTRDDRVHPGHARKMMARLEEVTKATHYFENIEGGHGGAADNPQTARMWALAYSFLWRQLT
jgi:prolyl oligopeptidase